MALEHGEKFRNNFPAGRFGRMGRGTARRVLREAEGWRVRSQELVAPTRTPHQRETHRFIFDLRLPEGIPSHYTAVELAYWEAVQKQMDVIRTGESR